MEYLQLYNKAKTALAEAYTVDELSAIIDQADIIKHAAQLANDSEMVWMATEIKCRAERRLGEISNELKKGSGGDRRSESFQKYSPVTFETKERILKSAGITKQMANKCEKLAKIPEEKFEQAISDFRKEGELSRAKLLRITEELAPKPKQEPIRSNTIFINNDDPVEAALKTVLDMGISYMRSGKTLDNFLTFLKHYIINYQKSNLS